jgi:HemY protein
MRGLLWLLALFTLAVGLSMAARFNDAYILMVLPPWRVEVSLNLAVTVLLGSFLLLYAALRGIALTLSLPGRVRDYRERRRQAKASAIFQEAVRLLFEGRFGHALKKAAEAHAAGEAPGLAALIAARAAQRMREPGKQEAWLDRATLDDARTEAARLMLEAEMCLDARRFEDAVAVLARLQVIAGRHIAALRLELRAQQGCGNWDEVLRITRQLEKRDAMAAEVARELKLKAHQENVAQRQGDVARLRSYLGKVPGNEIGPRLAHAFVEHRFRRAGFRLPVVAPFDDRWQRHQDRFGAPARLQAEQRAAIPDQIELDVATAPVGLESRARVRRRACRGAFEHGR